MKLRFAFVVGVLLAGPVFAETVDKIVAKVGIEVITQSELTDALQSKRLELVQKYGEAAGQSKFAAYKSDLLNQMILEKILTAELKRENISVSQNEVEAEFADRLRRTGANEAEFAGNLARYGLSLAEYKKSIERDLAKQAFIGKKIAPRIAISDYDLQQEYEKQKSKYLVYRKVRFLEALVTPEKFSTQEEMVQAVNRIRETLASGKPASAIISQYSSGAYAAKGGDSGVVDLDSLRPDIRQALSRLKPGETSQPLPAGAGVFVFKLLSHSDPAPQAFGEVSGAVRNEYVEKVVESELNKYLLAAKDQTYVEIIK